MKTFRKTRVAVAVYIMLAMMAAGCATTQEPIVRTEVREVPIPVRVRCVDPAKIPPKPSTAMDPKGDIKQRAAGASIDVERLKLYAEGLRALIEPCLLDPK